MESTSLPPDVTPPSRWPAKAAMAAGVVCLALFAGAWVQVSSAHAQREAVKVILDRASAESADLETQRALAESYRELRGQVGRWQRRRLGLGIAALVLLLGGFWAAGIRQLYDKMSWAEVDEPDDFEDF